MIALTVSALDQGTAAQTRRRLQGSRQPRLHVGPASQSRGLHPSALHRAPLDEAEDDVFDPQVKMILWPPPNETIPVSAKCREGGACSKVYRLQHSDGGACDAQRGACTV